MLQEVDKTFLQEIKVLLQMPEMSSKYIADGVDGNSSMFQLEVRNSVQICFMHYIYTLTLLLKNEKKVA